MPTRRRCSLTVCRLRHAGHRVARGGETLRTVNDSLALTLTIFLPRGASYGIRGMTPVECGRVGLRSLRQDCRDRDSALSDRALEQEGMHEGLREITSELTLAYVVLLREQASRAAGSASSLEPAHRLEAMTGDVVSQGHHEATEQERPFGVAERPHIVTKAIEITVVDQLRFDGRKGGDASGILRPDCTADCGHEQGCVDTRLVVSTLPDAIACDSRSARLCHDGVGQGGPRRCSRSRRRGNLGSGTQSCGAGESAVSPVMRLEFPDARIRLSPAKFH